MLVALNISNKVANATKLVVNDEVSQPQTKQRPTQSHILTRSPLVHKILPVNEEIPKNLNVGVIGHFRIGDSETWQSCNT
jgi:hypothetical protein